MITAGETTVAASFSSTVTGHGSADPEVLSDSVIRVRNSEAMLNFAFHFIGPSRILINRRAQCSGGLQPLVNADCHDKHGHRIPGPVDHWSRSGQGVQKKTSDVIHLLNLRTLRRLVVF